jgi:predicted RNase H-like HicB family nuclease
MSDAIKLTAVYEVVEGDWVQGRIEELPAVITAAPTLDEAKALLRDALTEYLSSLQTAPAEGFLAVDRADSEQLELLIRS